MTAVEAFVQALARNGVEWIATLCGHGLDPLFAAADAARIRLVDTRNEQTASYIADAYGKLMGRPGVCAVSSGVAHVNALSGVLNAWFDASPMLLVSGSAAVRTAGLGHFQDVDHIPITEPITRFARTIDHADRAVEQLESALHQCMGPPPGPVHLTFPMDVQRSRIEASKLVRFVRPEACGCSSDLDRVASALANAGSPLIVAGSGAWYAGEGEALMQFSERFSVPVVVPIWDRGCIERRIPTFMGVIGAATGGPDLLSDADCILLAGAPIDYRVRFLQPDAVRDDARVVRMDAGWDALAERYAARSGKAHSLWLEKAVERRDQFRQTVAQRGQQQAQDGLHAVDVLSVLQQVSTDDTVLLIDGGSIGQWAHQTMCDRYPPHWLTCGRSGVVGWGIGGAMGARLAYPERPIVLLSGDGAFTFNVADLECAARQRLGFVAIVADDQGWGITRCGHVKEFGKAIGSGLGPIAFPQLAEALGARGVGASNPEGIREELERGLKRTDEVTVIHVPIVGGNP